MKKEKKNRLPPQDLQHPQMDGRGPSNHSFSGNVSQHCSLPYQPQPQPQQPHHHPIYTASSFPPPPPPHHPQYHHPMHYQHQHHPVYPITSQPPLQQPLYITAPPPPAPIYYNHQQHHHQQFHQQHFYSANTNPPNMSITNNTQPSLSVNSSHYNSNLRDQDINYNNQNIDPHHPSLPPPAIEPSHHEKNEENSSSMSSSPMNSFNTYFDQIFEGDDEDE
jgi:hypothetical protein